MLEKLIIFFIFFLPFQFALQPSEGIDLAVVRVLAIGIFLLWCDNGFIKKRFVLPPALPLFFFTTFIFWAAISFIWAENTVWALRKSLFLLSFFPLFLVFYDVLYSEYLRKKIFKALVNSATLAALFALAQFFSQWIFGIEKVFSFWTKEILPFFLGPAFGQMAADYSSLLVNVSGRILLRAQGFFPDPHIAALFFGMSLPFVFWFILESEGLWKKYWGVCAGIILMADLLTFSRGGYVGITFGIGIFFLLLIFRNIEWKKQIIKIGAGAIIVAAILISPIGARLFSSFSSDDGSKVERVRLWGEALGFISLRPVAGAGLGNYPLLVKPSANYREPFYAHNLFLDIALEMGLVGLFFFTAFLFLGILYVWRKWKREKNFLALSILSSLIVFSAHSFFETPLFSVHILPIFLLLMAAGVQLQEKREIIDIKI